MTLLLAFLAGCTGSLELPGGNAEPWRTPRGDCTAWAYANSPEGTPEILWQTKVKSYLLAPPVAGGGAIFQGTPVKRIFSYDAETGERTGNLWVDVPVEDGLAYDDGLLVITGRSIYNRLRVYDLKAHDFRWSRKSDRAAAAPIICEGAVYYSTYRGSVFKLNSESGEVIWRTPLSGAIVEHQPTFRDSLLYVADKNARLFALEADSGDVRWEYELPSSPSGPALVIPDHVIIPTEEGLIPVLRLDGTTRVQIEAPGKISGGLACIGPTIYGTTTEGDVFAGDLGFGGTLWQTRIGKPILAPPVVWGQRVVAVTAEGGIYFLNFSDGEITDSLDLATPVSSSPIVYDGKLYIAAEEGILFALTADNAMEIQNDK